MVLTPKESGKLIAASAKDVFIETEGVKQLASAVIQALKDGSFSIDNFLQSEFHPQYDDPRAVDWIFVLDTLNFSFWSPTNSKKWTVNGQTGYFALCAAIKRAIEEGKPILDPKYYSKITQSEAEVIFRGDDSETTIPLMADRLRVLHEAGQVLLNKYKGTFVECIKSCEKSAVKLLKLIVSEFEAYRDEGVFEGQKVSFYKRAQILIGDIWSCFKGSKIGEFHDINCITMFADYRIPQAFLRFKAFRYSNSLLKRLQADEPLENGSREEMEIRGCSIELVERVCAEIQRMIKDSAVDTKGIPEVNAVLVDQFLWDYRRKNAQVIEAEHLPFHKTRTIYY